MSSQSLTLTVTAGTYAQSDVGSNITIDTPTYDLEEGANTDKGNYTLPSNISVTGKITKKALTIATPVVLTKVYDGGTGVSGATIASGGAVSGEAGAESFTLTVSGGTYSQSDVGSNLAISSPSFGLTAGGGAKTTNYQYTLPTAAKGSITKKAITDIDGVTVKTRPVDGTTSAKFDTAQATGAGVVTAEVAGFRGGLTVSGSFPEEAKTTAGTYNVAVTYTLGDAGTFKASNYRQSDSGDTLRGRVTEKPELVLTPATIAENGGESRVTATLSEAVSEAVTVTVSAAAVSPAEEGDFTLSANTKLTITAGATTSTGTVTIAANDNEVDAPNKEVTVSGAASGSGGESALADRTLTIIDDDERGLELSQTSVTVTEDTTATPTAQYTVALGSQPTAAVTVAVSSGAVATATVSPATLSYTTANWKTAQTVTVSAVDDAIDNAGDQRSATVTHTASGGDYGSESKNVAVTVSDDEGRSAFTVAAAQVNEGNTGTASLKFTVTLSPAADGATTVRWATSDGTATAGPDYTAGSGTLNFAAGATTKTVTVAVQGDEVDESNETLTLTLSDAGGGAELGHGEDGDRDDHRRRHARVGVVTDERDGNRGQYGDADGAVHGGAAVAADGGGDGGGELWCGCNGDGEPADAELQHGELEDGPDGDSERGGRRDRQHAGADDDDRAHGERGRLRLAEQERGGDGERRRGQVGVHGGCGAGERRQHGDGESEVHGDAESCGGRSDDGAVGDQRRHGDGGA